MFDLPGEGPPGSALRRGDASSALDRRLAHQADPDPSAVPSRGCPFAVRAGELLAPRSSVGVLGFLASRGRQRPEGSTLRSLTPPARQEVDRTAPRQNDAGREARAP